jgi:isoquinoline 1-oxidoreductase beta subunit
VPTGPWRSPGHSAYCWAYQSFFDEVALAGERDPLEFRLDLLSKSYGKPPIDLKRTTDTLKLAAKKADWGRNPGANRGLGLAFHYDHGGFVSYVAEVVANGSSIRVEKVTAAVDVGPIINLSGAKNQVEGCVVDALSTATLEMTFADGSAEQDNFGSYGLLRINQAPRDIECHFIQSDNSPAGLGEPPFAPVAPAVCNAIYAATGTRIRELPLIRSGVTI